MAKPHKHAIKPDGLEWIPKKGDLILVWDNDGEDSVSVVFDEYIKVMPYPYHGEGGAWRHAKPHPIQIRLDRHKEALKRIGDSSIDGGSMKAITEEALTSDD